MKPFYGPPPAHRTTQTNATKTAAARTYAEAAAAPGRQAAAVMSRFPTE